MPTFANFTRTAEVSEETVARFEASVPTEITRVWREDGAGLVGGGFVHVVDPGPGGLGEHIAIIPELAGPPRSRLSS
jgi:hypothetical protein